MNDKQKLNAISYVFQRSGLPIQPECMTALAEIADEALFPRQSTILNIGEKQDHIYLIVHGMARSYYIDEKGNDITKMFMRENEFLIVFKE